MGQCFSLLPADCQLATVESYAKLKPREPSLKRHLTNRSKSAINQKEKVGMKREILRLGAWITLAAFLATGCYTGRERVVVTAPPGEVIVTQEPPQPRVEVIGVAPTTAHVWVRGYWVYRNGRWVWIAGHWELRPRPGALWVAGHWDRTSRGWAWTPGHWQ
jgi:WXXGXW repeat (2 copies)